MSVKRSAKTCGWFLFFVSVFTILTYVYLSPGGEALVEGRTDKVMSDGTDPASLPWTYGLMVDVFKQHPGRYFYGAVYSEVGDAEQGTTLWTPWNERWIILLLSPFVPLEQLSTGFIFTLFLLNAGAMYLLSRKLGWSRAVSIALSIAWAFNPFTRARAKVHGALVGIYHLPLIFLGTLLVARGRSWRSIAVAALTFLAAATVAHYYLVTCVFLSPLFVAFFFLQPEVRSNLKRSTLRFVAAVLPAVLFLGLSYVFPVPSDAKVKAEETTENAWDRAGGVDPFLYVFHAQPIDYLAGDISLGSFADSNPLREEINDSIVHDLGNSNPHERTNGIRWIVLGFLIFALFKVFRIEASWTRRSLIYFLSFSAFGFWLSLSPNIPWHNAGASYWLYSFIPKVRVASRAGILVHFGLLMVMGLALSLTGKTKKFWYAPGLLAGLMIADYPPYQKMPMAPLMPAYSTLHRDNASCGVGLMFPYIHYDFTPLDSYQLSQRLRGTDCQVLNFMKTRKRQLFMLNTFPPQQNFLAQLDQNPTPASQLQRLATCVPLNFVIFHPAVPHSFASDTCSKLGWKLNPDGTCVSPSDHGPLQHYPEECL